MKQYVLFLLAIMSLGLSTTSCNKANSAADVAEAGQQIGDAMASIDEAGGSSGTLAHQETLRKTLRRLAPEDNWLQSFLPQAFATSCAGSGFSSCSSNTIVRNYSDCTIGSATFSGSTTLTWSSGATSCTLNSVGQYISRDPEYSVSGLRSATLNVSKVGTYGEKLTLANVSGGGVKTFNFSNDGIRRVFTLSGSTLFDYTTTTTQDLVITGSSRGSRTISGGTLHVKNNVSGTSCDYTPSNVSWTSSSCNCPTQGSWTGTCSDGTSTSLTITGCGSAELVMGSDTNDLSLDRCTGS